MTLEEFRQIKNKVLDEIKKEQTDWPLYSSVMLRGAMKLAMAVEEKLKEDEK